MPDTKPKINGISATPSQWAEVVANAVRLGTLDEMEGKPTRKGTAIADLYLTERRLGHERHLRNAYMAGRFHVRCMGEDVTFATVDRSTDSA
jgi:hypothetical protein